MSCIQSGLVKEELMENGVVNVGKKGKSQGIEGGANVIDVWVWMRPHIKFCTIGKCDLLYFF
jgi:hypothetical protein